MKPSFQSVKASDRRATANRKVKRAAVEERMVLLVMLVMLRDVLKVSCATYHSGATCDRQWGQHGGQSVGAEQPQRQGSQQAAAASSPSKHPNSR